MPVVDMSLEQLRTYRGISPKPADFDAYWAEAMAEMHAVDAKAEVIPAGFKTPFADCFELYFTGVGGARIHGRMVRPKTAEKTPLVLNFHGLGGQAPEWCAYLGWAAAGFTMVAMDCRGQHGLSEEVGSRLGSSQGNSYLTRGLIGGAKNLYYRSVYLDCAQIAELAMNFDWVDRSKVGVWGGSQGGGLTLVCAGLVKGINRIAPVFPYLCDFRRVWEMDLAVAAYHDIRDWLRVYDPRHEHVDEFFGTLGYIDAQFFAEKITAQVLMQTGLMDTCCPPSTQFAAFNRIAAEKEHLIYPDFGHEGLRGADELIYRFMLEMLEE